MNLKIKTKIIASILLCTICAYTTPVFAFTKDETVYSKINNKGENYQTIVSTHIENKEESDLIHDITDLLKIENTKGDEEFTQDGNSLVWKADKKDIYYQGESQKELPVECEIKYELEGKEVKPEEILGKAGHIKITIQYSNKEEHIININGKEEKIYTPFVAIAGAILQNDTNKNIEISNGKIINDGSKTLIMGIALPGLQESLGISKNEIEIPDNIEITMDSTNFELGNVITFVTPKVLEKDDLNFLDLLDEVYSKVDTLETASNQIQEGSVSLAEGTNQLVSGTKELKEGANVAYYGAKKIKTEVSKATSQLASDKTEVLDSNTLNTIGEQAKQTANLSDTQKKQIGSQAQAVAIQSIQGQKGEIGQKAENQVANLALTTEQKQQIASSVKDGLESNSNYMALPTDQQQIILQFSQNSAIVASETTARQTAKQVANMTAQTVAQEVTGSVANTTAQTVAQMTAEQTAQTTATIIAKQVAQQVKEVAQSQAITQMKTLGEGLDQLTNGLGSLQEGTNSLQSGANELNEGADTLAEGIKTFNEQGMKKVCDYIHSDVKNMSKRMERLVELSKEYDHFTMLNRENNGTVKFIMIMDTIKKQEDDENVKEEAILPTLIDKNREE